MNPIFALYYIYEKLSYLYSIADENYTLKSKKQGFWWTWSKWSFKELHPYLQQFYQFSEKKSHIFAFETLKVESQINCNAG